MKTAVLLLVLVAIFAVSEATYCDRCREYCSNTGCGYYMCVRRIVDRRLKYYCCCFKCAADSYFNIGRVSAPRVEEMREELPSIENN
uniref:Mytilin 7 n=1 Tax=Perna canaliculus TaxID=38949 RepID=A0A6B9XQC3_PERCI|nr:mytilin 7 [Perna canaliculus]